MHVQSDQVFWLFQWLECLVDGILPPRELTRRVDVMGLHVCCEVLLRLSVKVNHRFCQRVAVRAQMRYLLEHGAVEGPVNLLERFRAREVN
jgi:hypothetical protein